MNKRNKSRIITTTHNKIMIRDGELSKVLSPEELQLFNNLVNKVQAYDIEHNGVKES